MKSHMQYFRVLTSIPRYHPTQPPFVSTILPRRSPSPFTVLLRLRFCSLLHLTPSYLSHNTSASRLTCHQTPIYMGSESIPTLSIFLLVTLPLLCGLETRMVLAPDPICTEITRFTLSIAQQARTACSCSILMVWILRSPTQVRVEPPWSTM
jgi:hypothetical protein